MAETDSDDPKHVILNDRHEALGGRMVPFSGYMLPVQYADGIIEEHKWTRAHAGLFDVSHMGPAFVRAEGTAGPDDEDHAEIASLIEPLISGDIAGLKRGRMRYTLLLNDDGGILDDLMIARPHDPNWSGTLYLVSNAGRKEEDFALIEKTLDGKGTLTRSDDDALLALQGPEAVTALQSLVPGVADLDFMSYRTFHWGETMLVVSRSGYTGEDGFEILVPKQDAPAFWDALVEDERVRPAGLGARDSLRLEAGLPLYGHDLDETTSPIEAGLGFAVSKRRREAADFPGAKRILKEREGKIERVRVGLFVEGAPAREGADIVDGAGEVVGVVTSGVYSPTLSRAIAIGFVPPALSEIGNELGVVVRGRTRVAEVTKTPFVPHRYVRKNKQGHQK